MPEETGLVTERKLVEVGTFKALQGYWETETDHVAAHTNIPISCGKFIDFDREWFHTVLLNGIGVRGHLTFLNGTMTDFCLDSDIDWSTQEAEITIKAKVKIDPKPAMRLVERE